MTRQTDVKIQECEIESPAAVELLSALNAELDLRYPEDGANFFELDSSDVMSGHGAFLAAYVGDTPVGCGAVRRLNDNDFEIKRMYVSPSFRGHRIGKAILTALESEAKILGASRLVLEAGDRQPEALALYRRSGFSEIQRFGQYVDAPLSVCMAKNLGT